MFNIEFRLGKEERVIPVKNYKKEVFYAFCKERNRIQAGIAALVNYEKDFTDNHRYNYLRDRILEQRKRQEDRENSERI